MTVIDVLVIGGGQAGLATAHWLKRLGPSFQVVDAAERIGDSWRKRYASLTLFTPRAFSGLPGLTPSGDPAGYATGREFGDYLERYAEKFALPVRSNQRVTRLARSESGFVAELHTGERITASTVIVASGGFQSPLVPSIAADLSEGVQQLSAASYTVPADVSGQRVIVVGDGATGRDIATDLAGSRKVWLACGRPRCLLPEKVLGIGTWRWLRALGLLQADTDSPVGRFMRKADPFPHRQRDLIHLGKLGVELRPRVLAALGDGGALFGRHGTCGANGHLGARLSRRQRLA